MNCFPCFKNKDADGSVSKKEAGGTEAQAPDPSMQTFNFRELAMATKNFRQECLLGEGGFGRVFKGTLQSGEVVAVKQLDRNGMQENKEFTVEVTKLSCLQHPNLVKLIGYCADGDQRVLVYEYMSMGSLESHLFGGGTDKEPLDWSTRMKIASGAGQGLEYLHEKAKPAVVYGDVKPSNVLLDDAFEPKLSDVGLSTLGAGDGTNQPSSRMVDTFGYSAPEFSSGGEVTIKSDVYCFGVVLLELITGRRAIDTTRPTDEQNLVTWAQPFFRNPKRFPELADPRLNKQFPITALNQVVGIAGMCLQDEPMVRPLISDVTSILSCISMIPNDPPQAAAPPEQQMEYKNEVQQNGATSEDKSSTDSHSSSSSESEEEEGGSAENTQSSQISVGESESGSDSDSDDQSDDESTCRSDEGSQKKLSNRKSKKGRSSPSKRKKGSSRATVVTFKEPNLSSRHNADAKEESSSSSSEESSSESDDNEEKQSSSSRTKRAKQRGASESAIQVENGGHFDRNTTEPAELRNLDTR